MKWQEGCVCHRIYDYQHRGMAFTTVEDLLRAMDEQFVNYTRYSVRTVMKDAGFSDLFIDELVTGGIRDNYGQTANSMHGFVGKWGFFLMYTRMFEEHHEKNPWLAYLHGYMYIHLFFTIVLPPKIYKHVFIHMDLCYNGLCSFGWPDGHLFICPIDLHREL